MSVWRRHPHEPTIPPLGDPGDCPACDLWAERDRLGESAEFLADWIEKNVPGSQVMRPADKHWFVVL